MKIALGLLLAFAIGVVCRLAGIPVPAPPAILGALLVLAMTVGYLVADRYVTRPAAHRNDCGGPTGAAASERENES